MPEGFLPEFEMYVLLAVAQLGDEAYGLAIRRRIEARTGRQVSVGALYTTLARLEAKDYVQLAEPETNRGQRGRPRRYCSMTAAGRRALEHSVSMLGRMVDGASLRVGIGGAE